MSKAGARGAGGRYHHGDLRRALLDAALEILKEGGDLSLRGVARRAGVSHAAPYHHFPDRRALVAAIAEEGLVAFRRALGEAARRTGPDPAQRLREVGVAYVRFAVENPAHFRLMFSAELADRSGLPELRASFEAAYGVLVGGVRRVLGEGAADELVTVHATYAWSLVHGLANLILDRQVGPRVETPDAAEAFARKVLQAMHPPSARAGGEITGSPPPEG